MQSALVAKRIDWRSVRETIDIESVAINLLGPPPGRAGSRGLWWRCPFHDDCNPSFQVDPARRSWRCFGCSEHGDAAALVMRLKRVGFPAAVAFLAGASSAMNTPGITTRIGRNGAAPKPPPKPSKEWIADVLKNIEEAESTLWSNRGVKALVYHRGRGLSDATIRRARLGLILEAHPAGVSIPWFDEAGRPTMLNVRRLDGEQPKYRAVTGSRRGGLYPGRKAIKAGRPAIVVEGEFDALLLGQELDGLVSVVTTGSASSNIEDRGAFLPAPQRFAAQDADQAGDAAAEQLMRTLRRFRRVRPPGAFKDWSEAYAGGVNLRRWWQEVLNGIESPTLFTWDELKRQRWGPGVEKTEEGLDVFPPARNNEHVGGILTKGGV